MDTGPPFELIGESVGGYRPFKFGVPKYAGFFVGREVPPRVPGGMPEHECRGCYPTNPYTGWCYVTYTDRPFAFGELSPYDLHYESDIYPGEHSAVETRSVWVGPDRKVQCVSPPEWNASREPFRVRQSNPGRGESFYLEFCPIPDEDFDQERAAKAAAFWHAYDNPPPPCTPERVTELVDQLATVVPASIPRTPNPKAPGVASSRYPEALEAYFAAMHRNGLDQIWNLLPDFSPLARDGAIAKRKELTALEKQLGGRVPRFPGNVPWASGLFPIAYRDGWGLAVDVASKAPGAVWRLWPPEPMIQTHDSLCTMLDQLIAAYRDGKPFGDRRGITDILHANDDGTVKWAPNRPPAT